MAFVHSVAKPPRDVRRRQEKFGTGGAAVPEKIRYHLCCSVVSASSEKRVHELLLTLRRQPSARSNSFCGESMAVQSGFWSPSFLDCSAGWVIIADSERGQG